jgi:diguanylate cyclase (GGDEF)-like protein
MLPASASTETHNGTPDRHAAAPRRVSYALSGAWLAQGAALGLLLGRLIGRRRLSVHGMTDEIASNLGTYLYVAGSTTIVFSLFGRVVGRYADRLAALAAADALTGLLNARAFRERFHQEMVRATRYRESLSLLIVDVDGLKRINDEHGHAAGDDALCRVAAAIGHDFREADLGARIGGDEFAVLAPNTDAAAAIVFGERLRVRVAHGHGARAYSGATVSIGIASFGPADPAVAGEASLMEAADAALYRAKRDGGNTVRATGQSRDPVALREHDAVGSDEVERQSAVCSRR